MKYSKCILKTKTNWKRCAEDAERAPENHAFWHCSFAYRTACFRLQPPSFRLQPPTAAYGRLRPPTGVMEFAILPNPPTQFSVCVRLRPPAGACDNREYTILRRSFGSATVHVIVPTVFNSVSGSVWFRARLGSAMEGLVRMLSIALSDRSRGAFLANGWHF